MRPRFLFPPRQPRVIDRDGERAAARDPVEAHELRAALVEVLAAEIRDRRVLDAMSSVPRHLFVPELSLGSAYANHAAAIGYGQTISQPLVVALMTEALELRGRERVLEVGTGSGYQAAVLSMLASEIYSVEVVGPLADEASTRLQELGYENVQVRTGDGYAGWPEEAPFDRILVTAAPESVPQTLFDQLADGGVLVAPVGPRASMQTLFRYRKHRASITAEDLGPVRFVPMVGRPRR